MTTLAIVYLSTFPIVFAITTTTSDVVKPQVNTSVSTVVNKISQFSSTEVPKNFSTTDLTSTLSTTSLTVGLLPSKVKTMRYEERSSSTPSQPIAIKKPLIDCQVKPLNDDVRKTLSIILEKNPKILQYELNFVNDTLGDNPQMYLNLAIWERTKGRQGQALMMLPFYYAAMSFGMLSIGEALMRADVVVEPKGCLANLTSEEQISTIRNLLLNDFQISKSKAVKISEREYLCTQRIKKTNRGYGIFVPECCRRGPDDSLICHDLERGFWLEVLTGILSTIKVIIFLFCPLLIPGVFYASRHLQDKYKLKIEKPMHINVMVTENPKAPTPNGLVRINRKMIAQWKLFLSVIENRTLVPRDTNLRMRLDEVNVRMQKKKVISRMYVPVGLLVFLYDNFIRCRVRRNPPLTICCKANLFGKFAPAMFRKFTWINFFLFFTKIFLLLALPFPYYIRLYMYYMHEEDEMLARHAALKRVNLPPLFDGNFVAHLSPNHILFLLIYIIFVVEGSCIRLLSSDVRNRFKFVLRTSLREMRTVAYSDKMVKAARLLLYPLQNFGCFGFIIGVFYWFVTLPLVLVCAVFYCIPTMYLTARVLLNFLEIVRELGRRRSVENRESSINSKIVDNEMANFLPGVRGTQADANGEVIVLKRRYLWSEILVQIFTMTCTLATIYATTIIMVECCGFFVELIAFTLMGVIVNADVTMKYVSLVFLLAIYMYDSYKSVNITYKDLANTLIDNAKSRSKNVGEEAAKEQSLQENTAFVIHAPEDDEGSSPQPELTIDDRVPRWCFKRPLLFLDTQDFLYISQKFFEEFCQTTTAGCPGPVYISLMQATLRFLTMVAFLGFVLIVVMIFSDAYNLSTNNKMFATLAGGMLPFLLRNIFFPLKKSLTLSKFGFTYLYDEIVKNYQKKWEIFDLDVILNDSKSPSDNASQVTVDETKTDIGIDIKSALLTVRADKQHCEIFPSNDTDRNENTTLIDSGTFTEDFEEKLDLFIDLSINEKQVNIVKQRQSSDVV